MTILAPASDARTYAPCFDALGLALVVAHPTRPRPFLIDADNNHAGNVPTVEQAHATGKPYALAVALDVLAFDLDDEALAERADDLRAELADEGWPALRIASGRLGHVHLFIVVPDLDDRARIVARAVALGLPAPRTVMRAPGAPHRLGLPVEVRDDPADFTAAVAAVRAGPDHLDWRSLLATGHWPRGYTGKDRSGSALTWQICIGAARAGHALDDVRTMLDDEANAGGITYRRKGAKGAKWLTVHVWPSAATKAAVLPPADAVEARERLCALAEALDAHRWPGIAGATDRAILSALIARGKARGSMTPTVSYRELAEAAGCHPSAVSRAVPRLRAAGWLLVAKKGRGRTVLDVDGSASEQAHATRWRLTLPENLPARLAHTGGTPPASTSLSVRSSRGSVRELRSTLDACRWGALGLNAPRVLDALGAGPLDAKTLAEVLQMDRGNLRARLLPKLELFGLVHRVAAGWELADDLDAAMTRAAGLLGTAGKAAAVVDRHARERAEYLEHRERTRPIRAQKQADDRAAAVRARRTRGMTPLPFAHPTSPEFAEDRSTRKIAPPAQNPTESPPPIEALDAPLAVAGGSHGC